MADEIKTVVTAREEVSTKAELKAVEIVALPWWQIVGVRAARVYLQGLIGFLTSNATGATTAVTGIPVGDFGNQIVIAASLAVAPAVLSLMMNVVELLAKLDQRAPQLRG
jgi:hypothetical protein